MVVVWLAAMLMLGASGVLMGTRFYASIEADGAEQAKQLIRSANSGETVRGVVFDWSRNLLWPTPFTARTLINDHLRTWTGREIELMAACYDDDARNPESWREVVIVEVRGGTALVSPLHQLERADALLPPAGE